MKTKLLILIFTIIFSGLATPNRVMAADEIPVATSEAPSDSYLKTEKQSIATTTTTSASAASLLGLTRAADSWEDPWMPGDGQETDPNVVGGPIGDVSLPVILLILVIYFLYKNVTTSRRKNYF